MKRLYISLCGSVGLLPVSFFGLLAARATVSCIRSLRNIRYIEIPILEELMKHRESDGYDLDDKRFITLPFVCGQNTPNPVLRGSFLLLGFPVCLCQNISKFALRGSFFLLGVPLCFGQTPQILRSAGGSFTSDCYRITLQYLQILRSAGTFYEAGKA